MTTPQQGDIISYWLLDAREQPTKPAVGRVHKVLAEGVHLVDLKDEHLGGRAFLVSPKRVIANFGRKPIDVRVFGYDLNHLHTDTTEVPRFGPLHWFYPADSDTRKKVHSSCRSAHDFLKEHGIDELLDLNMSIEVRGTTRGTTAGMFHSSSNLRKKPARLWFTPEHPELRSINSLTYVLMHELTHAMHLQVLPPSAKVNARWVSLFQESVEAQYVEPEWLDFVFEQLKEAESGRDWSARCSAEEEGAEALHQLLALWRRTSRISPRDLNAMIQSDDKDAIFAMRPKPKLWRSRLKPLVSEYACKSVAELVAESVSFYACQKQLPKDVRVAVEDTLKTVKRSLPDALAAQKED